jgi:hypothetical protein
MRRPWFKYFGLPSAIFLLCLSLLPVLGGCSFYEERVMRKGPCYEGRDYPENRIGKERREREREYRREQRGQEEEGETEMERE